MSLSSRLCCLRNITGCNDAFASVTKVSVGLLRPSIVVRASKAAKGSTSDQVRKQAEKEMQSFWHKNITGGRPWSPHLQIYSAPLVMRFSFLHRATGIAMAIGKSFNKLAFLHFYFGSVDYFATAYSFEYLCG
uniref:SJCHGC03139 protein n=1 Tax=Schistosoma japonicum TaxID=6182 RepID=Q5DC80_SCHJA|nr:SJCHGC03139 protein [Schistosoma japonicum]